VPLPQDHRRGPLQKLGEAMKPIAYTIVLFAVSLSGCGESETEKQKVALETVRLQQEQLQELDKRKDEVKELESKLKGSQDAFEQFRKEQAGSSQDDEGAKEGHPFPPRNDTGPVADRQPEGAPGEGWRTGAAHEPE